MSPNEVARIATIASLLGMNKLKITGGEPLIRDDLVEIVSKCANKFEEISMTTNGTLLADYSEALKAVGLKRVNVSLDTLDHEKYRMITGSDVLDDVIDGIEKAISAGLTPLKINMVVMKGINENEIDDMIQFSKKVGGILQLIELETQKERINEGFYADHHCDLTKIESYLESRALKIVSRSLHNRKKYYLPEEVEIVRPMHNSSFCANCHRLRVTSSGHLKPCLLSENGSVDILSAIRRNASEAELINLFKVAVSAREPYWR
jgi:cyclic pyranopterin phosphate synthase